MRFYWFRGSGSVHGPISFLPCATLLNLNVLVSFLGVRGIDIVVAADAVQFLDGWAHRGMVEAARTLASSHLPVATRYLAEVGCLPTYRFG